LPTEQVVILTIAIHNAACNGRLSKHKKAAGIIKEVHTSYLATLLCHVLEDGMDIMTLKTFGTSKC
jgi:VIT1/CCC1 family predicted Fe2+/Mn2+ transporter